MPVPRLATGLQRTGIRLEVTESVLDHISGTRAGIAGVYQRHDRAEKRAALEAWAARVQNASRGFAPAPLEKWIRRLVEVVKERSRFSLVSASVWPESTVFMETMLPS
jgi:hypothetical protein